MINRHNYEIWFLDHAEGNLNPEDEKLLFWFLDQNADLKAEFESFEFIKLTKYDHEYTQKNKLKKDDIFNTEFTDIEKLAIDKIEHHISVENNVRLLELIEDNEENEKEFKTLELTKLIPDTKIKFRNKKALKKKGNVFLSIVWSPYSIAAVLIIILFASLFENNFKSGMDSQTDIENHNNIVKSDNNFLEEPVDNSSSDISITNNNIIPKQKGHITQNLNKISENDILQEDITQIPEKIEHLIESEVASSKSLPAFENIELLENPIRNVNFGTVKLIPYHAIAYNKNNPYIEGKSPTAQTIILTPKEFLIKQVKDNLDIDDKNYDRIDPVKTLIAVADKSKIVDINYVKDTEDNQKEISFSIGGFEFQRKW